MFFSLIISARKIVFFFFSLFYFTKLIIGLLIHVHQLLGVRAIPLAHVHIVAETVLIGSKKNFREIVYAKRILRTLGAFAVSLHGLLINSYHF